MSGLQTGVVGAVSHKNNSFKIGEIWYRIGKGCAVSIDEVNKGDTVTIHFNSSEKEGHITNWVNMLDFGAPKPPESPESGPVDEPPPIGKYASRDEMTKVDFNIMYGMCFNNVCTRAKVGTSWKEILEETEDLTIKVFISREDLWKRTKAG